MKCYRLIKLATISLLLIGGLLFCRNVLAQNLLEKTIEEIQRLQHLEEEYLQNNRKYLFTVSTEVPLSELSTVLVGSPILPDIGVTVLIDLDDYFMVTPEGRDGWITIWLSANTGEGYQLLPVAMGVASTDFVDVNNADPGFGASVAMGEIKLFRQLTGIEATTHGVVTTVISTEIGLTILSLGTPYMKFEIGRDLFNDILLSSVFGSSVNRIAVELALALFFDANRDLVVRSATNDDGFQPKEYPLPMVRASTSVLAMAIGGSQNLSFTIHNDGAATSNDAYLTLSVTSNLDVVRYISDTGAMQFQHLKPGDFIHDKDGNQIPSTYGTLDAYMKYNQGDVHSVEVELRRVAPGDAYVYYRATFDDSYPGINYINDPATSQSIDGQNWSVYRMPVTDTTTPPDPNVTVKVPFFSLDDIRNTMEITFIVSNNGGLPSSHGHLVFTMSRGLYLMNWNSDDENMIFRRYLTGQQIPNRDKQMVPNNYEILDAYQAYDSGESHTVIITVKALDVGEQWIYCRATFYDNEDNDYNDPESSSDIDIDGQGWPVVKFPIRVYGCPRLTYSNLNPPYGAILSNTKFTFLVSYAHSEYLGPMESLVYIDNKAYPMKPQDGQPYVDGKNYRKDYTLEINATVLGEAIHSYYFYFKDKRGREVRLFGASPARA